MSANFSTMREMTLREVQQVCLDILQDFHDFCVENNIHYSLSGGSLLGAIRHNGFIPWDDDVDVQMPRSDYDKFVNSYKSRNGYRLCCGDLPEFKNKQIAYPYARLCDTKHTVVDPGLRPWLSDEVGIWIDILPCDGISSDKETAKKHINNVDKYVTAIWRSGVVFTPLMDFYKGPTCFEKFRFVIRKVTRFLEPKEPYKKFSKLRRMYDYDRSTYFFTTNKNGMKEWQLKKNMEHFILHKFEDRSFYIMSGWDANLRSLFGDYMQLPPENQRYTHVYNRYYWK